jgi:hypothetical protein
VGRRVQGFERGTRGAQLFSGDAEHEELAEKQRPFFKEVRVFLEEL